MKSILLCFLFIFFQNALADQEHVCDNWPHWTAPACQQLYQIWRYGDDELYLTGYAWHNRFQYAKNRVQSYNENAWGGGLGKEIYDEKGDLHALYAFAFIDSHKNVEPIAGYTFTKIAHFNNKMHLGAGFTVFVTARPDIFNNAPFPGILPMASIKLYKLTFTATYIPGAKNAGNVLFLLAKWQL